MAVGYDNQTHKFLVRNLFSAGWGLNVKCCMPYDCLTNPNLAADFWAIQAVISKY